MAVARVFAVAALLAVVGLAADEYTTSPLYALSGLPNQITWPFYTQWRMLRNEMSAGGDLIAVRFYLKAGQYAAIGFSPYNMHGYITACNVPAGNTSAAVCTDVIGHNGGGVSRNPMQYSRLLWAKNQDSGFVECEVEIPVSAVNISYDAAGDTRLIFATSTWNSTSNMPEPHNADGKLVLHVNLGTGAVAQKSLPIATAASHTFQGTKDFSVWWFAVYNTTVETSYINFNYALPNAKRWGGIGVILPDGTQEGIACYYDTTAMCVDVVAVNGSAKKASKQISSIVSSYKGSTGTGHISVNLPFSSHAGDRGGYLKNAIFASGMWDTAKMFPDAPSEETTRWVNFVNNEVLASQYIPFALFPGHYEVEWAIAQDQAGFMQYKMRAILLVKRGYFAGLGFANKSMGGPLVACHMPESDALQVVCRDFIGQDEGGVVVNPVQSTKIIAAIVNENSTYNTIIVDIDLSKFNVSAMAAMMAPQRMIFAYGMWDSAKMKPTYHGPNATFFDVNIFTGKVHGNPHPTAPPPGPPATTMAPVNYNVEQTTCQDSACSSNCQTHSLPTNQCLPLTGGNYAMAQCHMTKMVVILTEYTTSTCTGTPTTSDTIPLNTCENASGGGSLKDQCVPASQAALVAAGAKLAKPAAPKHNMRKF